MLFLQSSELGSPTPSPPPVFGSGGGGGDTLGCGEGVGESKFRRGDILWSLYVCMHFVVYTNQQPLKTVSTKTIFFLDASLIILCGTEYRTLSLYSHGRNSSILQYIYTYTVDSPILVPKGIKYILKITWRWLHSMHSLQSWTELDKRVQYKISQLEIVERRKLIGEGTMYLRTICPWTFRLGFLIPWTILPYDDASRVLTLCSLWLNADKWCH